MPYPILTLPYPFSRRLHQLLTPEELQNLQIAAGRETRHLKPIIQSVEIEKAYFGFTNSKARLQLFDMKDSIPTLRQLDVYVAPLLKCGWLIFNQLNAARFKKSNFSHIYFKAKTLFFWHCIIGKIFLKMIASRIPAIHEISELIIDHDNLTLDNITLPFIFNLFPNITVLKTYCKVEYGWLSELLELKVTNLKHFRLIHTNLDELFSFTLDEWYRFTKMQKSDFTMIFSYKCDPDVRSEDVKKTVMTLLEPCFHTVADYRLAKIRVRLICDGYYTSVVDLTDRCWLFERCLNSVSKIWHAVKN